MKIKRFFAKDMRTALNEVKEELGSDAVIMSNKKVTGGVEIVAAVDPDSHPEPMKSSAMQSARDELAYGFGQAKRKLADDHVQLQQSAPSSRFANVLQNYAESQPNGDERQEDSLTALLQRQSKHRQQESEHSYHDEPREFQRHSLSSRHDASAQSQGYDFRAQKHSLDIGDYQRPSSSQYERELHVGNRAKPNYSQRPAKPRLDPSRYESKSSHQFDDIETMRSELASIRYLLEHQLSGLMWQEVERREPMRAMMVKRLEKMGLSDELADQLASYIPEELPPHQAWPALLDLLSDQIQTIKENVLESGGVVALLGPTGVGKTTTIAKLAARAAMEFGPEQIALVTTDTFRIGAHEQLATYGRIIGCPVRVAKDAEELADILHQLRHRRLVLLDTAGMGQRDIRLSEQLDTLMQNSGAHIRSLLVMPATAQRRVMQETIEHFRRIPLSGCVLTKLDESLSLGEVIAVTIQNALPIAYLADGQRVPEDIKVATGKYLVARANELLEQELNQRPHFWSSDRLEQKAADFYD